VSCGNIPADSGDNNSVVSDDSDRLGGWRSCNEQFGRILSGRVTRLGTVTYFDMPESELNLGGPWFGRLRVRIGHAQRT